MIQIVSQVHEFSIRFGSMPVVIHFLVVQNLFARKISREEMQATISDI